MTKVAILITTYNNKEYVLKCLKSLLVLGRNNYSVYLGLNGCTDNSYPLFKMEKDNLNIKCIAETKGFVNLAKLRNSLIDNMFKTCEEDYVLIIPPNAELKDKLDFKALCKILDDRKYGLVTDYGFCVTVTDSLRKFATARKTNTVSGNFMFFNRALLRKIRFSEDLHYREYIDDDFTFQIYYQLNKKIYNLGKDVPRFFAYLNKGFVKIRKARIHYHILPETSLAPKNYTEEDDKKIFYTKWCDIASLHRVNLEDMYIYGE